MPITAVYCAKGWIERGWEQLADGRYKIREGFWIPYVRNRFCNPLGRILGPKGETVKWIRRTTSCDVIIESDDVKYLKTDPKCQVTTIHRDWNVAASRIMMAVDLIGRLSNNQDIGNVHMSDYQLFEGGNQRGDDFAWVPEAFVDYAPNFGPLTLPDDILEQAREILNAPAAQKTTTNADLQREEAEVDEEPEEEITLADMINRPLPRVPQPSMASGLGFRNGTENDKEWPGLGHLVNVGKKDTKK